jgi:2-C-methyl-D-erythritol 4-phosphate cytidylyltransferase/2-C-methyl-D-erythritol 2,4-cyclodiphosphate synthase
MSKDHIPAFHVLIPAAGSGTRTGSSTPKQYCKAGGKTILRHTIEKFAGLTGLKSIRVIIDAAHVDLYRDAVAGLDLGEPVIGAATRKGSVANGLASYNAKDHADIILIHDAARPFVRVEEIRSLLDVMKNTKCATLAAPVADTLVDTDYNRLNRDALRIIQTPQAFRIGDLIDAHTAYKDDENFTDDAGLMAARGETIELVASSHENFKITSAGDMRIAEKLLSGTRETRTGMGYDVHEFEPSHNGLCRIGGVDIPHDFKFKGHSDADIVLHALTDAILGAISEGDIGQLFPPSDMQWKNADSEIFVKEAIRRMELKGGKLINADIVVIAEAPKIGPHRETMQQRIADMCGISPSRIGIKATTSEQMGYIGRHEGAVAQAVATITLPAVEDEA